MGSNRYSYSIAVHSKRVRVPAATQHEHEHEKHRDTETVSAVNTQEPIAIVSPSSAPSRSSVRVYISRKDLWLMMLIYLSPVLLLVMGSYLLVLAPPQADEALVCFLLAVGLIALNLALTYPCRYTLTTDSLNIRCGLVTKSIALDQICGVELSSSWRSAPALSLRRVRIRHNKGQTLVSPLEREPFIRDLTEAIARCEASRQGAP